MNIHEYQGKAILKSFGVRVQEGIVADTAEQAVDAAKKLKVDYNSDWVVIKAQIHAGGRGKGGGVKLAKNLDEVKEKALLNECTDEVQKAVDHYLAQPPQPITSIFDYHYAELPDYLIEQRAIALEEFDYV